MSTVSHSPMICNSSPGGTRSLLRWEGFFEKVRSEFVVKE